MSHCITITSVKIPDELKSCRLVVDEYEKTISEVLSERDREKLLHDIEVEKITNQRNQVMFLMKLSIQNFHILSVTYLSEMLPFDQDS